VGKGKVRKGGGENESKFYDFQKKKNETDSKNRAIRNPKPCRES